MDREQIEKMMGITHNEARWLKLNELSMSGDNGKFRLTNLIADRAEGEKCEVVDLGENTSGVIIKMRWRLFKYEEDANGKGVVTSTSEYDNKLTDNVFVFNAKEKGIAVEMKEKYQLKTQRVIYFYLPEKKEIVRLIVKASGLTGDKNPNGENGLFEYQNDLRDTDELPIDYITEVSGVFRENKDNPRKNYYAMTFKTGRKLSESERSSMIERLQEVDKATKSDDKKEMVVPEIQESESIEYPESTIDPDDIPF